MSKTDVPQSDVEKITQTIISELLKQYTNPQEIRKSLDTLADLFIEVVIHRRIFTENEYFFRESRSISNEVFIGKIQRIVNESDTKSIDDFLEFISKSESKKFKFEVPYEYITDYIYKNQLNLDYVSVEERLNTFAVCIDAKIGILEEHEIKIIEKLFRKFRRHLLLAINQKKYIDEVTHKGAKEAESIADSARNIADIAKLVAYNAKVAANNSEEISKKVQKALTEAEYTVDKAQNGAEEALKISSNANDALNTVQEIAKKAEETAQHAQKLANEADAQAKSTIANYISILGIFASIIFTLFGGVNLIGATVKLLEANSRWPYLTFIIALLMICLLTLLNMMIKWINSMNNLKGALDKFKSGVIEEGDVPKSSTFFHKYIGFGFYTRSVLVLAIVLGISMVGMYRVKKENTFNYSTETTTKNNVDNSTDKKPEQDVNADLNNETTTISKFTLTNNSKEFQEDKKED